MDKTVQELLCFARRSNNLIIRESKSSLLFQKINRTYIFFSYFKERMHAGNTEENHGKVVIKLNIHGSAGK
jgi:hypothetical protein